MLKQKTLIIGLKCLGITKSNGRTWEVELQSSHRDTRVDLDGNLTFTVDTNGYTKGASLLIPQIWIELSHNVLNPHHIPQP